MKSIFSFAFIIVLTSCHAKDSDKKNNSAGATDSASINTIADPDFLLNKLLDSSLTLAYKQGVEKSFELTIDSNAFKFENLHSKISFGNLFADDRKHLIIQRFINESDDDESSLYTDIFVLNKNRFERVVADTSQPGYSDNYLEDVNQDGYDDYIVYSYSPTGCCPRNEEVGYLYNSKNGAFIDEEFFNRETDSLTDCFFETSYGRDEFVYLYKYKWKGLRKVLLEEIYVTPTKDGVANPHPTSYTQVFYPGKKKKRINKLPKDFARLQMAEFILPLQR